MDDFQVHVYEPLSHPDSTRLLNICLENDQLECRIKSVRLSDKPKYEALSYAWGKPDQSANLMCDGRVLKVTPTLEEAMRMLHKYSTTSGMEWFWIDQICINQVDGHERTHQVQLMRDIYQHSIRTIIWIPFTEDDVASVSKAEAMIEELTKGKEGDIHSLGDEALVSMDRLLDAEWFTRCWILQEVALSRDTPSMLVGTRKIDWSLFECAAKYMYEIIHNILSEDVWYKVWYKKIWRVLAISHVSGSRTDNKAPRQSLWDLQSLLLLTTEKEATDPRDKIFALLGLAKETADSVDWPQELVPDYTRPPPTTFLEVTRYCILQRQSLHLLDLVDDNAPSHANFPSWVPRWDYNVVFAFNVYHEHRVSDNHKSFASAWNNASGNHCLAIDNATVSSTLRLRGFRVSAIHHRFDVVGGPYSDFDFEYEHQTVLQTLSTCRQLLAGISTTEVLRAFFMVSTLGQTVESTDAAHEPLIHFEKYLWEISRRKRIRLDHRIKLHLALKMAWARISRTFRRGVPSRYVNCLFPLSYYFRMFTTELGLLGMCRATLLPGMKRPYVRCAAQNGDKLGARPFQNDAMEHVK